MIQTGGSFDSNDLLKVKNECGMFVYFLVAERPSNMLVYLRDQSAQTIIRSVTLRQKLQIQLSISPSRSILTSGQPVPARNLKRQSPGRDRLGSLVVKTSASGAEDPGFDSRSRRDFYGSSHTSDLKIGTPVTNLPGAWHYRVSAGTGRPGVSIL